MLNLEDLTKNFPGWGLEGGEGIEVMRKKENLKFNGIFCWDSKMYFLLPESVF